MSIVAWIVLGLLAGLIANAIDPNPNRQGLGWTILLGIAGALVGGFLASVLFNVGVTGFNVESLVVAVIGSLIVLFVGRSLQSAKY